MRNVCGEVPDLVRARHPAFDQMINASGSQIGRALSADILGQLAWHNQEWTLAARWFTQAQASNDREPTFFGVSAYWFRLVALALSGGEIAGYELLEPGHMLRRAGATQLVWWGASATAVVLDRLSYPRLAAQFRQWVVQNDPGGATDLMRRRLIGASCEFEPPTRDPVDLDQAINQLAGIIGDGERSS
jgi:hypothetical protein